MDGGTSKSGYNRVEEDRGKGKKEQSAISIAATSFVPSLASAGAVGSNIGKSKALSPHAPVFHPKNFFQYMAPPVIHEQQEESEKWKDGEEEALDELRTSIHLLTIDPGRFEHAMPLLAQKLAAPLSDRRCSLQPLVEEIFGQCVYEVNFRYTGARMCNYLCISPEPAFQHFQRELLARCEKEYQSILSSGHLPLPHVMGYALFAGELLLNIKEINSSEVIVQLPEQISRLLVLLLENQSKEALLCCVQVLKLTGAVLEENLANLDDIFCKIEALTKSDGLSQNVICLLQSVINQRMNSWGQRSNDPPMSSGAGDSIDYPLDETSIGDMTDNEIYNNHSLSSDERDMANLMEEDQCLSDQYWIGDEKMDDETASAFEQFMAESQTSTAPRTREEGAGGTAQ